MSNAERIGAAYDTVAADYDRQLEPARWIRRVLWRHFDQLFQAGDKVLDLGCGTGIDAIHLARRKVHVTAIDASPQMLARFRAKVVGGSAATNVDVRLGAIDAVAAELSGPFDGIISSFGALNTVDLSAFAPQAARLLRPGGRLICHMLSTGYGRSPLARIFGRPPDAPDLKTFDVGSASLSHLTVAPA